MKNYEQVILIRFRKLNKTLLCLKKPKGKGKLLARAQATIMGACGLQLRGQPFTSSAVNEARLPVRWSPLWACAGCILEDDFPPFHRFRKRADCQRGGCHCGHLEIAGREQYYSFSNRYGEGRDWRAGPYLCNCHHNSCLGGHSKEWTKLHNRGDKVGMKSESKIP